MTSRAADYDLIIIGAGLSGCLSLLALKRKFPELKILVLEKNSTMSNTHTWCFHENDVPTGIKDSAWIWLHDLVSKSWPAYEVRFPNYTRQLNSPYHAITSERLAFRILSEFANSIRFGSEVTSFTDTRVHLKDTEVLNADLVLDASGWPKLEKSKFAFQKFVGLDVELSSPHGLTAPILKDVTVAQTDGYRFIYTLPWDENRCLIEDTYYSNTDELNIDELQKGILRYAEKQNWKIKSILRTEVGCLPLALYAIEDSSSLSHSVGAKSMCLNPVTGYTLPQTLALAHAFYEIPKFSKAALMTAILQVQTQMKDQSKYLRLLNRMMFLAARPERRYKILERFYSLDEGLIHRFYCSRLTLLDKLRILAGKPPVNPLKALRVLSDLSS